ncbi:MAG: hypothetical protein AAGF01_29500 [Cyanobacteria bacterium P01_G01_bin.38]
MTGLWLAGGVFGGVMIAIAGLLYSLRQLAKFLSTTVPQATDTLVIEGWIPDHAVETAARALVHGEYRWAIIVGQPIWKGAHLSKYESLAQLTADTLKKLGVEPSQLAVVPCPQVNHYRTYTAALEVKQWLQQHRPELTAVNVLTLSAHARRSWLVYRRTLAPTVKVGVIAAASPNYDPNHWWRSSAGFRHVISEFIAYSYARLFDWRA